MGKCPRQHTLNTFRHITLSSQGLTQAAPFGHGKEAVLAALQHLGYIQIDSLSVVARAHHHTLWTRIPDYRPEYLDALVAERKVFEYWFHAASYLPMQNFRYVLPQMSAVKQNQSHAYRADPKVMQYVMAVIRAEGPKKAADFESAAKKTGSWWNWKPAKLALEKLFMQGDLMVCRREGIQKVYDVCENVLPDDVDTSEPTPLEWAHYLAETHLKAYGFATVKQIAYLKGGTLLRKNVQTVLETMRSEHRLQKVALNGMPEVFIPNEVLEKTHQPPAPDIRLLSPFDNAIIHRDRIRHLFDFDFRLECYTPQEKRQYGYFCLPVLFGDTFIGRVDCKAHRQTAELELIHLHLENKHTAIEAWAGPFAEAVKRFAAFNHCRSIRITRSSPPLLAQQLRRL